MTLAGLVTTNLLETVSREEPGVPELLVLIGSVQPIKDSRNATSSIGTANLMLYFIF